jgi:hypothetical protein
MNEPITFRKIYQSSDYSQSFLTVSQILEQHRQEINRLKSIIEKFQLDK